MSINSLRRYSMFYSVNKPIKESIFPYALGMRYRYTTRITSFLSDLSGSSTIKKFKFPTLCKNCKKILGNKTVKL